MKSDYWILMADVIKSRKAVALQLANELKQLVEYINSTFIKDIYSPITITLGDEFQGVVKNKLTGISIIQSSEEYIIKNDLTISLRYVLHNGSIDTPINPQIAHGMLGKGLADARKILEKMKKEKDRFYASGTEGLEKLNKYWILYQGIINHWGTKDRAVVYAFLQWNDYKIVAEKLGKTVSQMWKREQSLQIREYQIIKELLLTE